MAALTVVALHVGERFLLPHYNRHAYLAVPFFFTLSGYVIAQAYEGRLRIGKLSLLRFTELRVIRLFPMVVLAALLAALLGAPLWSWLAAVMLLPIFNKGAPLFPANGPEWSLFIEVLGNLVHALLLRWLSTAVLLVVTACCGIATLAVAIHSGSLEVGWSANTFVAGLCIFGFSYFAGVVLFRLHDTGRLPRVATPFWPLVVGYLAVTCAPQSTGSLASGLRDAAATLVAFPLLVWLGAGCEPSRRLAKSCEVLGAVSYPLYITHHVLVTKAASLAFQLGLDERLKYGLGAVVIALAVGCAWMFYKVVDVPVREWLSGQAQLTRRQPSAGPA